MSDKRKLQIVKIGGNVLDNPSVLESLLRDFAAIEDLKILVHGGGKSATALAEKTGLTPVFHEGRRITNKPMLDIVLMTYAGELNKKVVARLQAFQVNAIGLSGADGNLILSEKRQDASVDFGFVGDVVSVDGPSIAALMNMGFTPVFCALTHDGNGQLLNTNADTIAAELAMALSDHHEVELHYCFEKKGVLANVENADSVVQSLTFEDYEGMKKAGNIHSGMLPKLENCFRAIEKGVTSVRIGGPGMLRENAPATRIAK